MKQTAVEWLFENIYDGQEDKLVFYSYLDEAKKMEKEQIRQFWDEGVISATYGKPISFEQYYNETFK